MVNANVGLRGRRVEVWSPAMVAKLRSHVAQGLSSVEIAVRLGPSITAKAVQMKCQKLRIRLQFTDSEFHKTGGWTAERLDKVRELRDQGLSAAQIAEQIGHGLTRNAVIGKLSRLNLTRGPKREERRNDGQRNGGARIVKAVPRLQYEMLATIYGEQDARLAYEPIDDANRCSLLDLTENRCRWPISTPGADDFCFCGNASPDGQPYCQGHSRLAYRPNSRARVVNG